jgi:hypothetical protein
MQDAPSLRRSFSRVVLGVLLAGAVYLLVEFLGFGTTRKQREIVFVLPHRTLSQVEVVYLSQQEIIRQVTLPAKTQEVTDSAQLPPGSYELQILLKSPENSAVSQRSLQITDEEKLSVDLSRE